MQLCHSYCLFLFVGLLVSGCGDTVGEILNDFDGDGSLDEDDCAPADPEIFPGATDPEEESGGVDSNCDGHNGVDSDRDGWASNALDPLMRDCDDENPLVHPTAPDQVDEISLDSNCDGLDGVDSDGDGDASLASQGTDCDDTDPALNSADADQDGYSTCSGDCDDNDPALSSADTDADEFTTCSGDCDDDNAFLNPEQEEVCDLLDNDCDGVQAADEVDEDQDGTPACGDCDDSNASDDNLDQDGDHFPVCAGDCDDLEPTVYPGAEEFWGDAVDQDCDGVADVSGAECSGSFTVDFPDGASITLDGCGATWDLDGIFDYLALDPPQFVSLSLEFDWVPPIAGDDDSTGDDDDSAGDDDDSAGDSTNDLFCGLSVSQTAVCGPGYYDAYGSNSEISYRLQDCGVAVPSPYRQSYLASSGYLRLDSLDTGSLGGNFSGQPITRTVEASLSVDDGTGVHISGSFSITQQQVAGDQVQSSVCVVTDGDEDGDGALAEYFGGDDCDDGNATVYPGAPELLCNYVDDDCDGQRRCQMTQVAAGRDHSCGIDSGGQILCWGRDNSGQGTVPGGQFTVYTEVRAGSGGTCGLSDTGMNQCWGAWTATPLGGPYSDISTHHTHACALDAVTGEASCWGYCYYDACAPPAGVSFSQVSAGGHHSCGLEATTSEIQCWGGGGPGSLMGTATPPPGPFQQLSNGFGHGCGIDSAGLLNCWGTDIDGQSSPPAGTFTQLSAGSAHNCAVDTSGAVQCWGADYYDQSAPPAGTFTQVSAGTWHSCGIDSSGFVQCWGAGAVDDGADPNWGQSITP